MKEFQVGDLVRSTAGRDAGKLYIIIEVIDSEAYLCDGNFKTIDRPKKKKQKHFELVASQFITEELSDLRIKRKIKLYEKQT